MTSSVKAVQQAALFARFGVPRQVRPDVVDDEGIAVVRVYVVPSSEAAAAFVDAEHGPWGNPARYELRESLGWCVIVDVSRHVAERRRSLEVRRSLWSR